MGGLNNEFVLCMTIDRLHLKVKGEAHVDILVDFYAGMVYSNWGRIGPLDGILGDWGKIQRCGLWAIEVTQPLKFFLFSL